MKLDAAQRIIAEALGFARARGLKPLAVAVLDQRGALQAFAAEDGTSLKRGEVARGKAYGCIAVGLGSRAIEARALKDPHFIASITHVVGGTLVPVAGGVLVHDAAGTLLGAVGISGDTSDNDEAAACAAIAAVGLTAETGR